MSFVMPALILASRSPRRAQLLRDAGFEFTQATPPYDDAADPSVHGHADAPALAMDLAKRKAVSLRDSGELPEGPCVILAADTICVGADGQLIGQPADRAEAAAMIRRFMNTAHDVISGVCILSVAGPGKPPGGGAVYDVARVHFGQISDAELDAYLDSDQWRGKAGAYNLFDRQAAGWPVTVDPCDDAATVVGLPMRMLLPRLNDAISAPRDSSALPHRPGQDRLHNLMNGMDRSIRATALRTGLSILAPVYRGVIAVRNGMFDRSIRRPIHLPRTTFSIGNITAGGTGKTPMTIALCRMLQSAGHTPAILLRGHGDDETHEYRTALGAAVPVEADPSRVKGAERALEANAGVDVFLLDDAFQHRQVARDLNIVLIDAVKPFGFGHVLPRGLLREPVNNLRRADAVIVTRADLQPGDVRRRIDREIEKLTGRPPIAHAAHAWHGYLDKQGDEHPLSLLAGKPVCGACGLGNPHGFKQSLARHTLVGAIYLFPDHHPYTAADLRKCFDHAHGAGLAVVTTEKDWVKWQPLVEHDPMLADHPPIYRPRMRIEFLSGEDAVMNLMRQRMRGE